MRRFVLVCLALVPLLLAARSTPPEVEEPETSPPRNLTIYGDSLSITPGETHSHLRFAGGVRCINNDMELNADVLELDLQTTEVTGGTELKLPQSEVGEESVVKDPGAVVRSMAAEMKVPSARFKASAIQRVGATGKVRVKVRSKGSGIDLATEDLVSTDGGSTWAASGRSTISSCDDKGNCYEVSADHILYDMASQKALARGAIDGQYTGGNAEPVLISAERVELNLAKSVISASEYLNVTYHGYTMCCGSLKADIKDQEVSAGNNPMLQQPELGLAATAAGIEIDLKTKILKATGGISVTDKKRGIELTADKLTAYLDEDRLVATGKPHLTQGSSTFDGEKIVVSRQDGKTVVEVDGPQHAKLNVDELKQEAQDDKAETQKEKGPPADGEPPVGSD